MAQGRICVSIPTDDEKTVKLGHFGDARLYLHYVYDPEARTWRLERKVENPYAGEHHHEEDEEHSKRPRILALQEGCNVIVAVAFGPGGEEYMKRRGIVVVRVRPRTGMDEALRRVEEALGLARG